MTPISAYQQLIRIRVSVEVDQREVTLIFSLFRLSFNKVYFRAPLARLPSDMRGGYPVESLLLCLNDTAYLLDVELLHLLHDLYIYLSFPGPVLKPLLECIPSLGHRPCGHLNLEGSDLNKSNFRNVHVYNF